MNTELNHLRKLTAALKENLESCAPEGKAGRMHDPTVDAVHDIRTGTRRLEATLDAMLRRLLPVLPSGSPQPAEPLRETAGRWLRLLKKIRRAAAGARDLDVHRKLLQRLIPAEPAGSPGETPVEAQVDGAARVRRQAEDLDAWLRQMRREQAVPLVKAAAKWAAKLEDHRLEFEAALGQRRVGVARQAGGRVGRRVPAPNAALSALEAFARLSAEMHPLDAGNLHDFRKGAKKARYMTEAGGGDDYVGSVGKALKRLQDEIGDWHDWEMLAEESERALGEGGAALTALIEEQRDAHFAQAIKVTERMRGRLMGEWQALSTAPVRHPRRATAARQTTG